MDKNNCTVEGCDKPIKCKGICHKHYNRKYGVEHPETQRKYDRSPLRRFSRYEKHCKREGIPFAITYWEWLAEIKDDKCYYCPNTLPKTGIALDRKYPGVGYFKDNVVPCCTDCNKTKGDRFSHIEYKIMMDALNEFRRNLQK